MNRERFPGLRDEWVRLDGPAGSQMVDSSIAAMEEWMRSGQGANHGGLFAAGRATDELIDRARASCAALLGGEPQEIAFGPSMTALTMRFAAAAAPGRVVCTRLDHDANVAPWLLNSDQVVFAEPDPETLELPAAAVEAVLTDDTDWVAITAASNACGTVPELPEIIRSAHAAGARVYVDAVHAAPHFALDVAELGCDALACSAYKWFGPHVGVLWARPEIHEELRPGKLRPSSDLWPDRWELGTLPFESLAGVAAAADYVRGMDWSVVHDHERGMLRIALSGLAEIEGVRLHGDATRRAPTIMFSVEGRDPAELAMSLAAREVAVWHGNYYAYELERLLGLAPDGAIRAGFLHYNTAAEAERFVEAVREVVSGTPA